MVSNEINHIHLVISVGTRLIASAEYDAEHTESHLGCLKQSNYDGKCTDFHHNSRLATVIGTFKAGVSRAARTRLIASLPVWQSRYHEYIIRNQRVLDNIMDYIDTNVENWSKDCFADLSLTLQMNGTRQSRRKRD